MSEPSRCGRALCYRGEVSPTSIREGNACAVDYRDANKPTSTIFRPDRAAQALSCIGSARRAGSCSRLGATFVPRRRRSTPRRVKRRMAGGGGKAAGLSTPSPDSLHGLSPQGGRAGLRLVSWLKISPSVPIRPIRGEESCQSCQSCRKKIRVDSCQFVAKTSPPFFFLTKFAFWWYTLTCLT